ncbi:MAG: thermonuclease family protein [Calditerrivibrio sp.]|nr:thermonuclease family protein [Calditerrivibrio sp.]
MIRYVVKFIHVILVFILFTQIALSEILNGKVVGVSDGDTITVLLQGNKPVKVRLAQIDAPEKNQDFGQKSKQSLSDMIYMKDVTVKVWDQDRYGRVVGQVFLNGIDINLEQIKKGMAWVYTKYAKDPKYFEEMEIAKSKKLGLWSMKNPIPPWEFRKEKKNKP